MSKPLADRWRLTLPLAIPALGGLIYLGAFGAPLRLVAVNAIALAVALVWAIWGRLPDSRKALLGLSAAVLALLFLPPLLHHDIDGVARWLPIGRAFSLHSGALLLPLVTVIAAREPLSGPWLLALAGLALALQPDAGALAGLAATSAALAWLHRSPVFALIAAGCLSVSVATLGVGDLAPQLYTEGVLSHVAERSHAGAVALGLLLFGAPLWFLAIRPVTPRTEGLALAALLSGFGAAAKVAPFPFPLIGYGASPILGFGFAVNAAGRPAQM